MANISTNQVLQFYVVDSNHPIVDAATSGGLKTVGTKKFVEFTGADGILRSDYIDAKNILDVKFKAGNADTTARKGVAVTLNSAINSGAPVAGEHYVLTINYNGFIGNEDTYHKFGDVYVTSTMANDTDAAELFYIEMVKSLLRNQTEYSEWFQIYEYDGTSVVTSVTDESDKITLANITSADLSHGFVIVEPKPYWKLGTFAETPLQFTVTTTPIVINSDEEPEWATIEKGNTALVLQNSKRIADLEHFAMGERGAQKVWAGWPYNTDGFEYLVDPNSANGYDVLTVHYAFEGDNHDAHFSEKDLVIVAPYAQTSLLAGLKTAFEALV